MNGADSAESAPFEAWWTQKTIGFVFCHRDTGSPPFSYVPIKTLGRAIFLISENLKSYYLYIGVFLPI